MRKVVPVAFILLCLASCMREERGFRVSPPSAGRVQTVRLTELQPGPAQLPEVTDLAARLADGRETRATVLRLVAEDADFRAANRKSRSRVVMPSTQPGQNHPR